MIWDGDMEAELKRLWADGLSASECAARLGGGVTRHAVLAKADRMRRRGDQDAPARRDSPDGKARSARERSRVSTAMHTAKRKATPNWTVMRSKPVDVEPYIERGDDGVSGGKQVILADLEDHHCRWPLGDPRTAAFRFCGRSKLLGLPYCLVHAKRAFPARYPTEPPQAVRGADLGASAGQTAKGSDEPAPEPSEREIEHA